MKSTGHALFGVSHSLPVLKTNLTSEVSLEITTNPHKPPRLVGTRLLIMVYLNVSPSLLKRAYIESVCVFVLLFQRGSYLLERHWTVVVYFPLDLEYIYYSAKSTRDNPAIHVLDSCISNYRTRNRGCRGAPPPETLISLHSKSFPLLISWTPKFFTHQ